MLIGAADPGRHETQYFEMLGSRAIYHNGWKAVTLHLVGPLYDEQNPNESFKNDVWELYCSHAPVVDIRLDDAGPTDGCCSR